MAHLKIGDTVPGFTLMSDQGETHRLSDYRGTKILLCFYDYAHCPKCAYSIGNLIGHKKKLAWAQRLKVVTVFLTDKDILHDGLTNKNAPIPRLCDGSLYPFLALADTDGEAATSFRLGNKSIIPTPRQIAFKAERRNYNKEKKFPPLPLRNFLPAEFLIDENGVIVDILRATKATEFMAMERIQYFLLDEKYSELKKMKSSIILCGKSLLKSLK
mmetsp:Transcript_2547/g.3874  ORF Transcript_2547/g.3874 Transcript_2547/m.3874 type:complete len:215 (-) Transcript_2547:213-857(-)